MTIIVLFGPPGSGKGTQAVLLAEKFNFKHISTGDLFRYNMKNDTPLGIEAKNYINQGLLVPDELTTKMLIDELERNSSEKGFILDGYPRTVSQAEELDKIIKNLYQKEVVDITLALEVEDEVLVERIKERAKSSGRADDANEEVIRARIKEYYAKTAVVAEHYKTQNKWVVLNGIGTIEEINQNLSKEIEKIQ